MQLSQDALGTFFAWAPLVILLAVVVVTWLAKRGEDAAVVPIGRSLSCARCGRRAHREQMVPQTEHGAVAWLCARCARGR